MEWHVIRDPNDPELDRLAARYKLHPLHIEDCRHRNQNAKIEESNGYLFAVLKPVRVENRCLEVSDLDIFVGQDFAITVEEADWPKVREFIEGLRADPPQRPDQLLYRVADGVIDAYHGALDFYDDHIDELEDEVLNAPTPQCLSRIFETKRDLILLRRVLANTRDVAGYLQRTQSSLIQKDLWPFLRDIYDHVARNLDTVEMMRDLLSGALDVYLSSVANRTNQVMKVLTVLGTVALPMLLISSFYGMNIKGLPYAESAHGLRVVGVLSGLATAALLIFLKLFRWL